MNPRSTSNPEFASTVSEWIDSNGEVFVVIRFVFGAGSTSFEFFDNIDRFNDRINELKPADSVIVMRDKQLPIRGVVDDAFVARALAEIPDGADWLIACGDKVTEGSVSWFHSYPGNNHTELAEELRDDYCFGHPVAVGLEPDHWAETDGIIDAYIPNADGTVTPGAY